uniref:Phd finger protein 14 n=1 Tax=Triatoma infestans TaxID=30076 RepID=A0A161M2U5_TRIIF
MIFISILLNN